MHRTGVIVLASLLATACQVDSPPLPSSWAQAPDRVRLPRPGGPPNRDELLRAIDQAQMKWTKQKPRVYELTVMRAYSNGVQYVSLVRGLEVLRSSGGYWPNGRDLVPRMRTVEGLFLEAWAIVSVPADEVSIIFDERFGYPKELVADRIKSAIDDELGWRASVKVMAP